MTNQNTDPAYRLLKNGVAIIAAATLIGLAALVYYDEPDELWASVETRAASPSIEIRP